MATQQRFYSARNVADLLGVSKQKVLDFIEAGLITAVNVAGVESTRPVWRISPADFESFRQARAAKPRPKSRRRKATPTKQYV